LIAPAIARDMAAIMPDAGSRVLSGGGHLFFEPESVVDELTRFFVRPCRRLSAALE
jgi:hypothetical protein